MTPAQAAEFDRKAAQANEWARQAAVARMSVPAARPPIAAPAPHTAPIPDARGDTRMPTVMDDDARADAMAARILSAKFDPAIAQPSPDDRKADAIAERILVARYGAAKTLA